MGKVDPPDFKKILVTSLLSVIRKMCAKLFIVRVVESTVNETGEDQCFKKC